MIECQSPKFKVQRKSKAQMANYPNDNESTEFALRAPFVLIRFIKTALENPVLWTGMKGASAKGRK